MENKFRRATEKDLEGVKYDATKKCAVCALNGISKIGSYRGPDFFICKECYLKDVTIEEVND